jgi:hypothetical protein
MIGPATSAPKKELECLPLILFGVEIPRRAIKIRTWGLLTVMSLFLGKATHAIKIGYGESKHRGRYYGNKNMSLLFSYGRVS